MIFGVDTSYANGNPAWQVALDDERLKFVVSRVCYGSNPADDDGDAFTSAHNACKSRSVPFGAYIFWLMGQDGAAQANHFLAAGSGRFGQISPVVDVEEGSRALGWGASVAQRIANLSATLKVIEAKLGQAIIYTNPDTWQTYFGNTDAFSGHRLWLAEYGVAPGAAKCIPGFKNMVLHQFSNGAGQKPIAGLSTPGNNVDRDVLIGNDLKVLFR